MARLRIRHGLHAWADAHLSRGWSEDTPAFLVEAYPALLQTAGELDRLVELALDPSRQDWLIGHLGSDEQTHREIRSAERLNLERQPIDRERPTPLSAAQADQ